MAFVVNCVLCRISGTFFEIHRLVYSFISTLPLAFLLPPPSWKKTQCWKKCALSWCPNSKYDCISYTVLLVVVDIVILQSTSTISLGSLPGKGIYSTKYNWPICYHTSVSFTCVFLWLVPMVASGLLTALETFHFMFFWPKK